MIEELFCSFNSYFLKIYFQFICVKTLRPPCVIKKLFLFLFFKLNFKSFVSLFSWNSHLTELLYYQDARISFIIKMLGYHLSERYHQDARISLIIKVLRYPLSSRC